MRIVRSTSELVRRAGPIARPAVLLISVASGLLRPQDLAPRAYVITPTGSHAVILASSFSSGEALIDPTGPLEDARGTFQIPSVGYFQSFGLLGRSSNLTVLIPYARGNFEARVNGSPAAVYRSGLGDARIRFSVNLHGGPAMNLGEYVRWSEKRLIGASLTVAIPNGQYDPVRLINTGTNRWGFKPEVGFSRKWNRWVADLYTGAWFFTANKRFFPGENVRAQEPIGAVEAHLGYYLNPKLWASLDGNFWVGNRSTVNGVKKEDRQRNSRIGATVAIPITRRQSVKFSYSQGTYVSFGGDFRTVSAAWQYSWLSRPQ